MSVGESDQDQIASSAQLFGFSPTSNALTPVVESDEFLISQRWNFQGEVIRCCFSTLRYGVPKPEAVDKQAVLETLPHGGGHVNVVQGGLQVLNETGKDGWLIANAIIVVSLDDGK